MGMGDLFKKATMHDGYATRESGEAIHFDDVDMAKLQASRVSNPYVTSWNFSPNDPSGMVPVNNSKGAIGGMVHPSTVEVRNALKATTPTQPQYTSGFSQAVTETPQSLPDPGFYEAPILEDSYDWNPSQYWMGKPASDDDESQVGQIS